MAFTTAFSSPTSSLSIARPVTATTTAPKAPVTNDTSSFGQAGVNPMVAPAVKAPIVPANLQVQMPTAPAGGPLSSGRASGFQGPRPVSQASTAAQAQTAFDNGNIGGAGGAVNMNASPAPAPAAPVGTAQQASSTSPLNYYMESALNGMARPQAQASQTLGQNIQQQGTRVLAGQQATANTFNQAGQGFDATTQNVAARPTGFIDPRTGQQQMTPGFNVGATGAVNPSQLSRTPTIGQIAGVAGQLGAAPQVGQVGNIQNGAAPGGITGLLGQQGAANADQAGMLGRLNGFLDSQDGPSIAEAQLQQAQAGNMADLIGAARSGRGGAGAQAQALRGAMSEGSAIMSDTAGQLATLRAQEDDMRRNRQLSAIGLGGEMATAQRGQDLGFRGQNLQGLQGDQSTALGARGQDIQSAMANQGTQTALEQLRAQTALGARGQNLSALQGDQSTTLGREGLAAQTALAGRGQDLSLLQGNQSTALGMRGQDASVLTADADRNLAGQRLNLDAGLGYGNLANDATGQGLNFLSQANQQGLIGQGQSNDMYQNLMNNYTSMANQERAAQGGVDVVNAQGENQPSFLEQLALNTAGGAAQGGSGALAAFALSDERAKTDVSPLDSIAAHLRGAPGYSYRYKPGVGEDPDVEHAGPMAQDLERGPFGRALVKQGPDGLKRVDTSRLSLVNHAALASMRSELDKLKAQLEA